MPETAAILGAEPIETTTSTDISTVGVGGVQTDTGTGSNVDTTVQDGQEVDLSQLTRHLEEDDDKPFADSMPVELRNIITQNQAVAPHIQRLWDRLSNYSNIFPTPREAREFRDMFPGGSEDARSIMTKAAELDRSNELIDSNDPSSQLEVLSPMFDSNPDSFMGILRVSSDLVASRNPQLYSQFSGEVVTKHLQGEKFDNHLEGMENALAQIGSSDEKERKAGIDTLLDLSSRLVGWGKKNGYVGRQRDLGRQEERPNPKLTALEKENQSLRQGQWTSFASSVNSSVKPSIEASLKSLIEPALKGIPEKQRKATGDMLVRQAYSELEGRLKQDKLYQDQFKNWSNLRSFPDPSSASKFITGRAQVHAKAVVKQILQPWVPSFVADKNNVAAKEKETGTRVDVTNGNNTAGRRNNSTLTQKEADSMTPNDIIGWARAKFDRNQR